MKLATLTKDVNIIQDIDLTNFMRKLTGKAFEITESPNDTCYYFSEIGKYPLTEYNKKNLKKSLEEGWIEVYNVGSLLKYFLDEEYISDGNYLLRVSW